MPRTKLFISSGKVYTNNTKKNFYLKINDLSIEVVGYGNMSIRTLNFIDAEEYEFEIDYDSFIARTLGISKTDAKIFVINRLFKVLKAQRGSELFIDRVAIMSRLLCPWALDVGMEDISQLIDLQQQGNCRDIYCPNVDNLYGYKLVLKKVMGLESMVDYNDAIFTMFANQDIIESIIKPYYDEEYILNNSVAIFNHIIIMLGISISYMIEDMEKFKFAVLDLVRGVLFKKLEITY